MKITWHPQATFSPSQNVQKRSHNKWEYPTKRTNEHLYREMWPKVPRQFTLPNYQSDVVGLKENMFPSFIFRSSARRSDFYWTAWCKKSKGNIQRAFFGSTSSTVSNTKGENSERNYHPPFILVVFLTDNIYKLTHQEALFESMTCWILSTAWHLWLNTNELERLRKVSFLFFHTSKFTEKTFYWIYIMQ